MEPWELIKNLILPYLMGAVTLSVLSVFFGKKIFLHLLSKDIEKYKVQLSEKAEVLKSHLSIFAFEQNVTFSRIDNQRANAISNVHLVMRKWVKPTAKMVAEFPIVNASDETYLNFYNENGEEAYNHSKELSNLLGDNSIYFDEDLYQDLVNMTTICLKMSSSFLRPIRKALA